MPEIDDLLNNDLTNQTLLDMRRNDDEGERSGPEKTDMHAIVHEK